METKTPVMSKLNKEKWIPMLHFLLSFFYEWTILIMHPQDHVVAAVAKDFTYGNDFERVMGYVLSKAFALLFICLIWKLIFYVERNAKRNKSLRWFAVAFATGAAFLLFLWPNVFYYSVDNYVTYSYAIRLYPEYWHNAYSSVIYTACLMVIPHPFSICLLQWLLFVFQLGYAWNGLGRADATNKKAKYLLILLLLVPETFVLISDPYRTEQYALTCMAYLFTILIDVIGRKEYSAKKNLFMIFFSALIATWRTEGILLGALGYLSILLFVDRGKTSKKILRFCVFCAVFFLVSFPQKVGNVKYYGSDYSIINSFPVLKNVFCRQDSNLSYAGAQEDLAAIEAVVPIEAIQAYGMDGYRRYNAMNGHKDINQSLPPAEVGKRYVKAFYNICLHNPKTYALTQIGMLKTVLKFRKEGYVERSDVVLSREYPAWEFEAWDRGKEDFMNYPLVKYWDEAEWRQAFANSVIDLMRGIEELGAKTYLSTAYLVMIPLLAGIICLREAVLFWKKRKEKGAFRDLAFAYFLVMLLGQYAAIALVMPAGVLVYFHAVYYCTLTVEITYFGFRWKRNENRIMSDNLE